MTDYKRIFLSIYLWVTVAIIFSLFLFAVNTSNTVALIGAVFGVALLIPGITTSLVRR